MKSVREENEDWLEKYSLNNNFVGVVLLITLWGMLLIFLIIYK